MWHVIAGKRRLHALRHLAVDGKINEQALIACRVIDETDDADEISLVENVVREDMHPADQFEAFKALIDKGAELADVAARFGVSETVVKKRLLMANLAPEILQALRDGKITLAMAQAFTVTEDHERQKAALADIEDNYTEPDDVRGWLTKGRVPATDKRAIFVTLPVYEQAGGIVTRDLFTTDDSGIYLENPELLDKLTQQQLEGAAESLRAQGWAWVDITLDSIYKYVSKHKLSRVSPQEYAPMTPDAKEEHDRLQAEYDQLDKISEGDNARDLTEEESARYSEIEDRMAELEDTPPVWTDKQKAACGIVLEVNHNGKLEENAYARPEDKKSGKTTTDTGGNDEDGDQYEEPDDIESGEEENGSGFELPRRLIKTLSEHRTAALAAKLAENPDQALALACWAMGDKMLYEDGVSGFKELFGIDADDNLNNLGDDITPDSCKGFADMVDTRRAWEGKIPEQPELFWEWCIEQKRQKLLNLFAYLFAKTVDATCYNSKRLPEADLLHELLQLDMAEYFTPTTENYFKHIGKATILANLTEALNLTEIPDAWAKLSHDKLAEIAEREIAGTGWIPEPLRAPPLPVTGDETADEADEATEAPDDGDDESEDSVAIDIVTEDEESDDDDWDEGEEETA